MKSLGTLAPAFFVMLIAVASQSCKRDTDAIVRIRVVENSINQLNPNEVLETPVVQAEVFFYQRNRQGTEWLEESVLTNTNGIAEYVFPNPVILSFDVTHGGRSKLENSVILEAGETVERVINLDE